MSILFHKTHYARRIARHVATHDNGTISMSASTMGDVGYVSTHEQMTRDEAVALRDLLDEAIQALPAVETEAA
jgi:hypothetical protein